MRYVENPIYRGGEELSGRHPSYLRTGFDERKDDVMSADTRLEAVNSVNRALQRARAGCGGYVTRRKVTVTRSLEWSCAAY